MILIIKEYRQNVIIMLRHNNAFKKKIYKMTVWAQQPKKSRFKIYPCTLREHFLQKNSRDINIGDPPLKEVGIRIGMAERSEGLRSSQRAF